VLTLSPTRYGKLLSKTLPKRIENDAEFDRFVETMEKLSLAIERGEASPEEEALHSLLSTLIREYDDRTEPLPPLDPLRLLHFLMDQRDLQPADLTPIFGARSIASLVLSGKRELSKAHIRRLAEFFHVSPALFLEGSPGARPRP
jgi:HTH-type transcriptional regulator/antitoxin HigA